MKKRRWILLGSLAACILLLGVLYSKHTGSTLSENGRIDSVILKETMEFSVYLPPEYYTSANRDRHYPVLYLLHGSTGDHTIYPRKIGIRRIADTIIRRGECEPLILVMPKSRGGSYANLGQRYRYEDYFFRELIPTVEKNYRVKTDKESRFVAGHSMGGHGALLYGLKHPDKFAAACVIGGAFELKETFDPEESGGENDLNRLLQNTVETRSEPDMSVRFYIDCGKSDGLLGVNERLHRRMTNLDIPHEYHVGRGGHTWEYWREAMPGVLRFVCGN